MGNNQTGKNSKELEHNSCSTLLDEVKQKVRLLRESGVSESEIASLFYVERPLPMLIISKDCRIFLGDKQNEVHMEPLVRAIYMLFLRHPEGIIFKTLPDYRKELTHLYDKVKPWGLTDRTLQSIEDVTNPLLNSINEKCARIKKVFLGVMEDDMARHYYIDGPRGEAKKISLPRDLVVWE
jgi:hypothetical protein